MKDAKGGDLKPKDYVLIVNPPGYPGISAGDLGRVRSHCRPSKDGTVPIELYPITINETSEFINLPFEPKAVRRIDESILIKKRLGLLYALDAKRILTQYKALKKYRGQ